MRTRHIGPAVALGVAAALAAAACSHSAPGDVTQQAAAPQGWRAQPGWPRLTLTDTSPAPALAVKRGSFIVVTVPRWGWGHATDVQVTKSGLLREVCTVELRGKGRRTIFVARRPGAAHLGATVAPASNLEMPAWGGTVVVRAT
jgi:hypothetical protein